MLIDKNQDSAYRQLDSIETPKGYLTAWRCLQPDNPAWDAFLNSTPLGHFYQTSMWAQVRALDGWDHLIVVITINDSLVGGFQILIRSKSYLGIIGLLLKGPVVGSDDPAVLNFVIDTLKKIAKVNKIKALIVQPPDRDKEMLHILSQSEFSANHLDYVIKDNTVVIDLQNDEEEIFNAMKHNKRKNIKTAMRMGIRVREGNIKNIDTFFSFMVETCNRQNVKPSPSNVDFLYRLWDLFSRHNNIRLFLAEYEKETVSCLVVLPFGKTAYLWKFGWSGKLGNYRPNEILYFEIFKWAKANGFEYVDMGAISSELAEKIINEKKANQDLLNSYSNFKAGFGGEVAHLTKGFVYIYNPIVRWAYNFLMPYINSAPFLKRKILFGGE